MTEATRKAAVPILNRLRELDQQTTKAYYEMGQLLCAIRRDKLYEQLGYDTFSMLIEEELSFSHGTAGQYIIMYTRFQQLGYTKKEALALLYECGYTDVCRYLHQAERKVSIRAVRKRIQEMRAEFVQINFGLTKKDYQLVKRVLIEYGADPKEGRLMHASRALTNMAKSARKGDGRPAKLKRVA